MIYFWKHNIFLYTLDGGTKGPAWGLLLVLILSFVTPKPAFACDVNLAHNGAVLIDNKPHQLFGLLNPSLTLTAEDIAFICDTKTRITPIYKNRYNEDVTIIHQGDESLQARMVDQGALFFIEDKQFLPKIPHRFYDHLYAADKTKPTQTPTIGTYQSITGVIHGIKESKKVTYINFDEDWKTDFTVLIDKKDWPGFASLNLKAGDRVTVRGWVESYYGPMIKIQTPFALRKTEKN